MWDHDRMATGDSIEAAKYYIETLTHWDRVDSAYKRNETSRDELDAAWEARKSAFDNLQRLEQAEPSPEIR